MPLPHYPNCLISVWAVWVSTENINTDINTYFWNKSILERANLMCWYFVSSGWENCSEFGNESNGFVKLIIEELN